MPIKLRTWKVALSFGLLAGVIVPLTTSDGLLPRPKVDYEQTVEECEQGQEFSRLIRQREKQAHEACSFVWNRTFKHAATPSDLAWWKFYVAIIGIPFAAAFAFIISLPLVWKGINRYWNWLST